MVNFDATKLGVTGPRVSRDPLDPHLSSSRWRCDLQYHPHITVVDPKGFKHWILCRALSKSVMRIFKKFGKKPALALYQAQDMQKNHGSATGNGMKRF